MVKKLFGIFMAALFVFGFVGQGLAAFSDAHLIRVVYDQTTMLEQGTDLGLLGTDWTLAGLNQTLNANTFSVSTFGSSATAADLKVAYFIRINSTQDAYISGGDTAMYNTGANKWSSFQSATGAVMTYYGGASAVQSAAMAMSGTGNSYWVALDKSGTAVGSFANFIVSNPYSDASLAGGAASQTLYFFNSPNAASLGVAVASIQTILGADGIGYTVINPSAAAVPIPPSVLLLGSGLLGLVGLRRKAA